LSIGRLGKALSYHTISDERTRKTPQDAVWDHLRQSHATLVCDPKTQISCRASSMHDSRQDGPTTYRSCRPFAFPCHENFPSWLDGAIVDADVVDQAGEEGAPSGIPSGADTHGLRGLRSWAPPTFGHDHIVHMHRTECSRQSHQGWAGQLRYGKFGSF